MKRFCWQLTFKRKKDFYVLLQNEYSKYMYKYITQGFEGVEMPVLEVLFGVKNTTERFSFLFTLQNLLKSVLRDDGFPSLLLVLSLNLAYYFCVSL